MTAKWNTNGYPWALTTDNTDVGGAALINGVESAASRFSGSTDPSTAPSSATWGAAQVGYLWLDTTDADTPVLKQWQQTGSGPATYGWRTCYIPKLVWLTTPVDAVASTTTAADIPYTTLDLTATLDASVQDSVNRPAVRAVLLRVLANCTTGAIPAGDTGFVKVRENGSTNEIKVHAQVAAKPVYQHVWVGLDSGEVLQYGVDTNAGAVTMTYELKIVAAIELL